MSEKIESFISHKTKVEPNQVIIAVGARGLHNLTNNKEYICINGTESGIFSDRPYVTVIDDNNNKCSCHQSRFKLLD